MTLKTRARVALAVAMTFGGSAFAQVPADRVPADSIVYLGWRGTADPGPGYAGSRWAAALKESNFAKLIDDTLPAAGVAADRRWPERDGLFQAISSTLRYLIKQPSAAFFAFDDRPRWGVFCRAGADAAKAKAALDTLAARLQSVADVRVVASGTDVGLVGGYGADGDLPGGLDQDAAFKSALGHVVADPTSVFYVNFKRARELATTAIARNAPAENAERFDRFFDASGLAGVNAYLSAEGFDGRDWAADAFLDAPAPRKGLLASVADTPLDAALIKRIPASSNTARVFRFDAAGLLNDAREITSAVDPEARDMLEKVVGASKMTVGRDLTADLLPSLGTQWAAYTSSDVGGTGGTGIVLVNRLRNPAKAKQAMVSLSLFLSNSGQNLIPDKSIKLAGRMIRAGDLQVYYTATPLISPAWTIKDDCLYVGLFPQHVIEAARYGGPSIDTVSAFAALTQPTNGRQPLAVSYTDVLRTFDDGYEATLTMSRLVFGLGDMFLAPSPEPLVPSLPALRAQLTPATTTIWADDAGVHLRARSPFPGAETMATARSTNLYAAPVAISVLLPSLNKAREAAQKVKSASNLRQMGLASMMYANDHRGALPPSLGEILRTQEIAADVFLNSRTNHTLPAVPAGVEPVQFYAGWVDGGGDYVYLGRGGKLDNTDAFKKILAYEKPVGFGDGINVLFLDGHVEWVTFDNLDAVFANAGLQPPAR